MIKQKPLTLEKLHQRLVDNLYSKNPNKNSLAQNLNSYAEVIIREDKQSRQIFDCFCELGFLDLLKEISRQYHLEVMKTICLLLVNLQHPESIAYLLSHSLMSEIIVNPESSREECLEYYVSMLKSLALRLDPNKVALFYNEKYYKFPLAEISGNYYNHPESLVRTSSMSTIFTLMKIQSAPLVTYFSSFPFSLLYLHLVCFVRSKWIEIDAQLMKGHTVKSSLEDQKDFVMLLHDIMELGYPEISLIIKNCIAVYLLKPILKSLLLPSKGEVSMVLGLYLLLDYLTIFKEQKGLVEFVLQALFSPTISATVVSQLQTQTYIPKSYRDKHWPSTYLDKYPQETSYYFKRILDPQTPKPQSTPQFVQQLQNIKHTIGYDIGVGLAVPGFWFSNRNESAKLPNPIREIICSLFKTRDDLMLQLLTKILIFFLSNRSISNECKERCYLHFPALDDGQTFNETNRQNLKQLTMTYLGYLDTQMLFRQQTLTCIFYLLDQLLSSTLLGVGDQETLLFKKVYQKTIVELRKVCKSKSKEYITSVTEKILGNQQAITLPHRIYQPNFLSLEIEIDDMQDQAEQLMLVFNSLCKLRYKHIRTSKLLKPLLGLQLVYKERFRNPSSDWTVGRVLKLQDRSLTECFDKTIKKSVIVVNDSLNLILVMEKEKSANNEVVVIVNSKFKDTKSYQSNEDTVIEVELSKTKQFHLLEFQNEYLAKMMFNKINELRETNIKQELVFLLSYLQDCLNDI